MGETLRRAEARLTFLRRLLMQKGAQFKLKSRLLLAQEIRHQERLVKVAKERGL